MINAFKTLLHVGLDLLQGLVNALMELFKFVAKCINGFFQQSIHFPGLTQIYELLMDGDECPIGRVSSSVLAVPFILLYKAITGEAPFRAATAANAVSLDSDDQGHVCLGIIGIVRLFYGFWVDFFQRQGTDDGFSDPSTHSRALMMVVFSPLRSSLRAASADPMALFTNGRGLNSALDTALSDEAAYVVHSFNTGVSGLGTASLRFTKPRNTLPIGIGSSNLLLALKHCVELGV
ncbi:MAG: hypothetical protein M1830_002164 [Pleopsidium flavum]|nr:MAG: hypothetical protein M1830_002164 [Pleopsidium flavum]